MTLRENTERPITFEEGSNTLVGTDPVKINEGVLNVLEAGIKPCKIPTFWDGKAAERIVSVLLSSRNTP